MTTKHLIPADIMEFYEVHEWRNAAGVLFTAHPTEWDEVLAALRAFRFKTSDVLAPGKNKSELAKSFDATLTGKGWKETHFSTAIKVDEEVRESPTHKVDCYKNRVALEVEWNNKDPFYDRDLNNFRLLFDLRVIDVGIIVTRCSELQDIFNRLGKGKSYGNSTTHMKKLIPRIEGGGGGGCPILIFGITSKLYIEEKVCIPAVGDEEPGEEADDAE
ncbi:BglII/BstYI family type II restriction endonuclease [Methylocystis sp. JAN1]|uniref:BglII/BstYI family type II restriction endonuclease n=1 Tax=Methylocystis sp. JAN1 TaxID=3397211 RepID=UPI003FA2D451